MTIPTGPISERLTSWYQAHAQSLTHYANTIVNDWPTAQDITHDAFAKVLSRVPLETIGKPETLLRTVVHNAALDYVTRTRRTYSETHLLSSPVATPLEGILAQERKESLDEAAVEMRHAVSRLPERFRVIVEEHYFKKRPYRDIARELNLSTDAVAVAAFRARRTLARYLASPPKPSTNEHGGGQ